MKVPKKKTKNLIEGGALTPEIQKRVNGRSYKKDFGSYAHDALLASIDHPLATVGAGDLIKASDYDTKAGVQANRINYGVGKVAPAVAGGVLDAVFPAAGGMFSKGTTAMTDGFGRVIGEDEGISAKDKQTGNSAQMAVRSIGGGVSGITNLKQKPKQETTAPGSNVVQRADLNENTNDVISKPNYLQLETEPQYVSKGGKIKMRRGKVQGGMYNMNKGGVVEGPAGKDKVVNKTLNVGDHVIPTTTPHPEVAGALVDALGLNKKAPLKSGTEPVNLTKGEVIIPADKTAMANGLLSKLGLNLDALSPNADGGDNKSNGGRQKRKNKENRESFDMLGTPNLNDDTTQYPDELKSPSKEKTTIPASDKAIVKENTSHNPPATASAGVVGTIPKVGKPMTKKQMIAAKATNAQMETLPTITPNGIADIVAPIKYPDTIEKSKVVTADPTKDIKQEEEKSGYNPYPLISALQLSTGLMGQQNLGKLKLDEIDPEFSSVGAELRKESGYGMSPLERSLAMRKIELNRKMQVKNILSQSGGNAGVALGNIGAAGLEADNAVNELALNSEKLKYAKLMGYKDWTKDKMAASNRIFDKYENRFKEQEATYGADIGSGINTMLKDYQYQNALKNERARTKAGLAPTYVETTA